MHDEPRQDDGEDAQRLEHHLPVAGLLLRFEEGEPHTDQAHHAGGEEHELGAGPRVVLEQRPFAGPGRVEAPDVRPDPEEHEERGDVPPDEHRHLPRHEPRDRQDRDRARGEGEQDPTAGRLQLIQALRYWRTARNVNNTMITTQAIPKRMAASD